MKETLYVSDCYYTTTSEGPVGDRPLIQLCGVTTDGEYTHVTVDGFRPYFFIAQSEYLTRRGDIQQEIESANPRVKATEHGHTGIIEGGTVPIVKIICTQPWHVKQVRGWFERTWEADVLFHDRFLMDMDITRACTIPVDSDVITPDDVTAVDSDEPPRPRVCTVDIEVYTGDDGVPDVTVADKPVTALTAHDSLTDSYWTGVLEHPRWATDDVTKRSVWDVYEEYYPDEDGVVQLFSPGRDDELLYTALEWISEHHPAIMVAWYNQFDIPYIVNRALNEGCDNIYSLSPTGSVNEVENTLWDIERCIKGIQQLDAIDMYKKTQVHELPSKALDDVAADELGYGKVDLEDDFDNAWMDGVEQFTRYNVRDVQAVVEIIQSVSADDMYTNIQTVSGALPVDVTHNSRISDAAVLREVLH